MVAEILPPSSAPTSTSNTNTQQNELTVGVTDVVESNAESNNGGVVSVPATPEPLRPQQGRSPLLTTMMELPTTNDVNHSPSATNHRGIQIDTDDEEQPGVVVVEEEIPHESGGDALPPSNTSIPTAAVTTTITTSYSVSTTVEGDNTLPAAEHSYRGRTNVPRASPHNSTAAPALRGAAVIPTSPISMMHHNNNNSATTNHPNAFVHPSVVTRTSTPHHQNHHHHQSILLNSPSSPLPTPMSSYTSNPVNLRCINPASGRVYSFVCLVLFIVTYHDANGFFAL